MNGYLLIIFIGFAGFLLAAYLGHKKRKTHEHLVCPLNGNCGEVIRSRYSAFLGFPVERLGLIYYTCITIGYGIYLQFDFQLLALGLLFASTFALVFSFYLTFIQLVSLRKICSWCLLSASFCLAIFVLSFHGSYDLVTPLLAQYKEWIVLLHVLTMAFGLCAASLSDVFFFRFLKDYHISKDEALVLDAFSQMIWLALGMIVVTGLALFLPQSDVLLQSPTFLLKMLVILVIILNGAFLNLFVAPRLVNIAFGIEHQHQSGELHRVRRLTFLLGPISVVSWYTAFILGSVRSIPMTFQDALVLYVFLIAVGVYIGYIIECRMDARARRGVCKL